MKNIHVLSTDKLSRLSKSIRTGLALCKKEAGMYDNRVASITPQHIYITNDEEIKLNDYWLNVDNNTISNGEMFELANDAPSCKKIILTTYQDLIKDGVKAIDDEFLEWFVKNPSCEEVEVKRTFIDTVTGKPIRNWSEYKIIIPKEEPLSFEEFRKIASKELLEKFDNDCLEYSEDGDFDNYFYANCKYWESKLKEEFKQDAIEYSLNAFKVPKEYFGKQV